MFTGVRRLYWVGFWTGYISGWRKLPVMICYKQNSETSGVWRLGNSWSFEGSIATQEFFTL